MYLFKNDKLQQSILSFSIQQMSSQQQIYSLHFHTVTTFLTYFSFSFYDIKMPGRESGDMQRKYSEYCRESTDRLPFIHIHLSAHNKLRNKLK